MLPIKLKLENFFSHKSSEVDFSLFNSALLVGSVDGDYAKSNGSGKCLSASTVLTNAITGERISIKDFHDLNVKDFMIWGMDDNYKLSPTKIVASQFSGKKKLLKITTANGLSEIVSTTHPVFTSSLKTIPASDLSVGDYVGQPRSLKVLKSTNKLSIEQARILALFLAEGSLTSSKLQFTNINEQIVSTASLDLEKEFFARLHRTKDCMSYEVCANSDKPELRKEIIKNINISGLEAKRLFGNNYGRALKYKSTLCYDKLLSLKNKKIEICANKLNVRENFRRFLTLHGMYNKKSIHKTMPEVIFREEENIVGAFIGMFISCDGYISDANRQSREISIGLGSEKLISDFQILFKRFGIFTSKRYKAVKLNGKVFNSWIISINVNKSNFKRFYDLVYTHILGPKKERLKNMMEYISLKDENPNMDIIPSEIYFKDFSRMKKNGKFSSVDGFLLSSSQYEKSNMSRNNLEKHALHISDEKYLKIAKSDIFWSKIVKIEDAGYDDTYDIQIDNETHLYALDGFITHNSSVMEGILWCLYNKSRSTTIDDVITWGENKCEVSLQFSHAERQYLVKRIRIRNTSTSTVDISVLEESGNWKSLSGSTSGETNDRIVNLLKIDYKTFINSAYFRQNDISEFATSEASKKKDILKSIIDISRWDGYEKEAKKKMREVQTEIVKVQARYDALSSEVEKLLLSEGELLKASSILEQKTREKEDLQSKVDNLSENYLKRKNNIDTKSWDKAIEEIASLKSKGKDLKTRYDNIIPVLTKRLNTRDDILAKINSLDNKTRTLSFDPDIEQKLVKVQSEWIEYSGAIQQSKIKLKELSEVHLHKGTCYTCNQNIEDDVFERLSGEHSALLEHYNKKKQNSEARIIYLSEVKKDLERQKADNLFLEKSKEEISSLSSRIEVLSDEIKSGETEKDNIYSSMVEIKRKISSLEEMLSSLKDETFQTIHDELKLSKNNLSVISKEMLEAGIKVGSLKEKTLSLAEKKKDLLGLKSVLGSKTAEIAVFDKMVKMFGKTGIQSLLLDAVISDLEKSANRILSSISDQFSISLETQRVGSDGTSTVETLDLNVKKDGSLCGFSSLSGGEQFRIALSLRIALSELATQHGGSSLEFLLLDEINSPLDKNGVETLFVNIIKQLETKYKILVITHDEGLKERFENVLDVSKVNGDSTITFLAGNISS